MSLSLGKARGGVGVGWREEKRWKIGNICNTDNNIFLNNNIIKLHITNILQTIKGQPNRLNERLNVCFPAI